MSATIDDVRMPDLIMSAMVTVPNAKSRGRRSDT
jgi:hypothetical protein